MKGDKQPITKAEAIRMLDAYMNPARMLKSYKDGNPNAKRGIELVASELRVLGWPLGRN